MRNLFFTLIFTLLASSIAGKPYYFRHYRIDNGLPNNTVVDCIQDSRGFLWFGTKEGLARFDGYQ
ncbi:MAG TPA: two-component regulator propeller domain-containing protein, partial [Bacteroidales bacterium]|nr:two-component regulator propeller domain-containing protein [Bacteroidales bacterium]